MSEAEMLAGLRADCRGLAQEIIDTFPVPGGLVATAESCTGGLIAGAITDIAGSSAVLDRGFVTYSNEAKQDMLGVKPATLAAFGAVSPQVATEMVLGARRRSRADFAVSVTGVAGPGGGSPHKPVGLVWMGLSGPGDLTSVVELRWDPSWSRDMIRAATVRAALEALIGRATLLSVSQDTPASP
ncbi:competence/damage-inducible protein CinA-like protein [Hoeflea sp. IMCC20628]|uniref:CinA family protein n=1 Tax=Hoeflea sp. IMCC20628 TaxID=1620421 RepID=UPI00063BEFA1|nr:CinA family protein [Hoeflea sp. IMCC20628]AKI00784.1 competence/damage-inducible protein CinA-like protein [Hoeflea sp. IMCC20628]